MRCLALIKLLVSLAVLAEASVHNHLQLHPHQLKRQYLSTSHSTSTLSVSTHSPPSGCRPTSGGHANGSGSSTLVSTLAPSVSTEVFSPSDVPREPLGTPQNGQNALPQSRTNGNSSLGILSAPHLPKCVGGSLNFSSSGTYPWGNRTAGNTNPYTGAPTTGVTRTYNFVISRATIAPDGVERAVLLINDQFPGPTIEANWGDTIQVTVTNSITNPEEGTAIHWHGILQTGTPWMDGVPGIQQCPIAPGATLTYSFIADIYGTSWYHAHYSAQYAGGILGPMIIYGPTNAAYDLDLGPVLLTDYYHTDYFSIVEDVMGTDLSKIAPYSDNNLINGKGSYNCSLVTNGTACTPNAGYSKFSFTTGKVHRLRLINGGAEGIQKFSIDGHSLTVIAYDFVPIVPYNTTVVTLGIGQRADVLVTASMSSSSSVWMRSTISTCSLGSQPYGYAMIYYPFANTTAAPTSTAWTDNTSPCANDPLSSIVPYYATTPGTPATIQTIDVGFEINSTGNFLWTMNGQPFRVDYNDPMLEHVNSGNLTFEPEWNVYDFGSNSSIRIFVNNTTPVAHPMHLHGHNFWVLAEGTGDWDGTIVNPDNPTRRDVQLMQPDGYLVIQFNADNPGVWPFHCHIAWHVSGGLYVTVLERADLVEAMEIPSTITNTCSAWKAYTNADVVDQIDSGL